MAEIKEEFSKVNDYTLRADTKSYEGSEDGVRRHTGYSRTFNFLARQVTTVYRDWLSEGRGSNAGGSAAIATHVTTENFDDLPSVEELKLMHAKLVGLQGKPPALEEVLPNTLGKKNNVLRAVSQ